MSMRIGEGDLNRMGEMKIFGESFNYCKTSVVGQFGKF